MIFSLRSAVLKVFGIGATLLALVGAAQSASPVENAKEWDVEIRCCFARKDVKPGQELEDTFLILLSGSYYPVGHLKLTTPKGVVIGFDKKTKRFTRPKREGVYGLFSEDDGWSMLDPEWHNNTPRMLALFPEKGEYTLQVIAERDGKYSVRVYPIDSGTGFVPIKAGEIHTYVFPGEFELVNPLLPGPNRFYLKRVK